MTNTEILALIRQVDKQNIERVKKGIGDNYIFQINWKKENALDPGYWAAPQVVRFLLTLLDEGQIDKKKEHLEVKKAK